MFKKVLLASMICGFSLANEMVNAIVAVVENEPITLVEIQQVTQQLNGDKQKALDVLIKDRLEEVLIKQQGIFVSPFEVNKRIEQIATQNGLTNAQFRSELELRQGIKFKDYKQKIEERMLREKLHKNITTEAVKKINEQKAKEFYENNKKEFMAYKNIEAIVFQAADEQTLKTQMQSSIMQIEGVNKKELSIKFEQNPQLVAMLSVVEVGEFSPIFRGQNSFDAFYVKSKSGEKTMAFNDVKERIFEHLYNVEQQIAVSEYLEKAKSRVKILNLRDF